MQDCSAFSHHVTTAPQPLQTIAIVAKLRDKKNLAASDVVMKAFQTGDASGLDSVIADDFIDHTDRGDKKGRDSLKAMVNFVHANFKDMKMEKIRDAADGDYVYSWMTYSGTSDGNMGMPKGPYKMSVLNYQNLKMARL